MPDQPYFNWVPITKRLPLVWPSNARVALAVIVNLEHWDWQLPPDEPGAPPVRSVPMSWAFLSTSTVTASASSVFLRLLTSMV